MKPGRAALIQQALMLEYERHKQAIDAEPDLRCFAMLVYIHGDCIEHIEVRKNSDSRQPKGERPR